MAYKLRYFKSKIQPAWRIFYKDHHGKRKTTIFHGTDNEAEHAIYHLQSKEDKIRIGLETDYRSIALKYAIEEFLSYRSRKNRSPKTILRYRNVFKVFLKNIGEDMLVGQIKPSDIACFETCRLNQISINGVAAELRHLRSFFNW